jgi:hypothetical protein
MKAAICLIAVVMTLLLAQVPSYAISIETLSGWTGNGVGNFGEDNSGIHTDSGVYATYGQTFKILSGMDNVLQSITFYVNDAWTQPDTVDFAIYLYEWGGTGIVGDVLYASPPLSTTQASGYEEFKAHAGGVQLKADTNYVAFMSASRFFDGEIGFGSVGLTSTPYLDGKYVFMNNKMDFDRLVANPWRSIDALDLAFRVDLTPVPEPSTLCLLATGIAVLARMRRRA